MSNQPNMIQSNAMPQQVLTTMPPGSKGPMDAGVKMQQQQTDNQMALIGKKGGSRYRSKYNGGAAPVVQVPPVTAGVPHSSQTGDNYKGLTELAQQQQTQAVFDKAQNPGDTAALQAQQQAMYKGGNKRGGSWPKWGCLSGGLNRKSTRGKSRRVIKSRRGIKRKERRNKKNKTRKNKTRRH